MEPIPPSDERLRAWLRPFWSGRAIDDDPLFFVQDGGAASAPLLFDPRGPVRLAAANGSAVYELGRDYVVEGRSVRLLPGSRVPFKTRAEMFPPPGAPQSIGQARDGKSHLFFGEGRLFHDLQSVATYRHGGGWDGPKPGSGARHLPRTVGLLKRREPVRLVALGDSITAGGNASGRVGAPPEMPAWPELTAWALQDRFRSAVTLTNLAVGGMASDWGIGQAEKAAESVPDLMWIAFGMNDASGRRTPADFAANVERIVAGVRTRCPQTEFVLVATMTGNADWSYSASELYPAYRDALAKRVGKGIALADVTAVWEALLRRKAFRDLTGNGVNHPNDFGHRVYAQTVLAALGVR